MTGNMTLNIICAIIAGAPMFYIAWWFLQLTKDKNE
jgi:hypothetical protein